MNKEMKTYLIRIPKDNDRNVADFNDLLHRLWESIPGEKVAFEIVATGQNIAFCFTASEAVAKIVSGLVYSIAMHADIVEVPDFTSKFGNRIRFQSCEFFLARNEIIPIKSKLNESEKESLAPLLSALSQCCSAERLFFQVVVCPKEDTGLHHFRIGWAKRCERIRHFFRLKYWFKRGLSKHMRSSINRKLSSRLWRVNVRIGALTHDPDLDPEIRLRTIVGATSHFNTLDHNQLMPGKFVRLRDLKNLRLRSLENGFLLSTEEVATLYHLPNEKAVPNITQVLSRKQAPPLALPTDPEDPDISFFGHTNFRNQRIPFGIRRVDRRRHMYMLGKTGTGKSKLLELLVRNDLYVGRGVAIIDPHGDLVDNILRLIPKHRVKDVVLYDPTDVDYPPVFNPFCNVSEELKPNIISSFVAIFKKMMGQAWNPYCEHIIRCSFVAMLDIPGATLLTLPRFLSESSFRKDVVHHIQDASVKRFWEMEYSDWAVRHDTEAVTPFMNLVGQFSSVEMIRKTVGYPTTHLDFADIIANRKLFLFRIPKGLLGESNSAMLGGMALAHIFSAAIAEADILAKEQIAHYVYVDDFQDFATETFCEMIRQARRYRLSLTLANQSASEIPQDLRNVLFGNVGSYVSFRMGANDAKLMEPEFAPRFEVRDLINLPSRDFCVRMSIDGETKEAFSGRTLRMEYPETHYAMDCVEYSRKRTRDLNKV